MRETMRGKVLFAAIVTAAAGLAIGSASIGQEAKGKKSKARVPPYYADIVTETQRLQIYAIQDKYTKPIADLQAQLDALMKERDTEIESLLNADQKARLRKARDDAAAKKTKTVEKTTIQVKVKTAK
jgi:hypothetical protein